jgi:DNA-binding NarL/FixJ family response regulator
MLDVPLMSRPLSHSASSTPSRIRSTTSRVMIVDDQPIVRRGLVSLFVREPDFEVCGEAGSFSEALKTFHETRPHVVTVEIVLGDGSGLDLIRELSTMDPNVDVVVLSMHDETLYAERALRAGAKGFLSKTSTTERIVDALRRVLDGRIYLSDRMTDRMLCRTVGSNGSVDKNPIESLSDRELEVFEHVGRGVTTRLIAEKLHLSPKTVETYRENIKCKLNLRNAMELTQHAVKWVLENG